MTSAWADLPNAALIDELLAAMRDAAWTAARDAAWTAALDTARAAARDAARAAALDAARDAAWNAARDAAWNAARDAAWAAALGAAWNAAWNAVAALIAWDDAAELYPLTPAQLRLAAALLPDNDHRRHAAVLLLPYAIAREMCDDQRLGRPT